MVDLKEEQKYERLRKLGQELHIPMPEAFWTLEVFDKDGKLIQKHHQRSHSWTRNAYNLMFSQLAGKDADDDTFGAGKLNFKDTGGGMLYDSIPATIGSCDNAVTVDGTFRGYRALGGISSRGILVGSGENAESFEDFMLQTPIAEGTGANQLNHAASEAHAISYSDTTLTNTLIRYFNNNTVGETSVDVNEVGLVPYCEAKEGFPGNILFARDKLASTVTIPSTGQLKVTYTIQLAYPA